jgi:hypothetical protein
MTQTEPLPAHVSYARVITPSSTYHAFTLQYVDDRILVHVNGDTMILADVEISETVQGWRCAGTNIAGEPEIWTVRRLSCGCNRSISTTKPEDVPA